ncbi:SpaA isopeptide-forming pilin-related protein [Metaclostridioides mangenotii]|uniref:LPXTG-motif cell wall-anchored protein n=1 Tax=Metaclostridioides mangenotii TaxID=1540 RepID=A0ABS4E8A2_9FIRM|nr:SpaA isopeptide-forming pilin-related protein [Clostridioides mangenotii]MBP1854176.1 LPXTG-motif cell wall-anchored protein [Clostridioides mangenotii]
MKKLLAISLTICLILSNIIAFINPVKADEKKSILDSAKLIHSDSIENHVWGLSEAVTLEYKWSIKSKEKDFKETFSIPDELKIENEFNSNILTSEGIDLGTLNVTTDGKVTVHFTDQSNYIEKNNDIKGVFTFNTIFNPKVVDKPGDYKIDFGIGPDTYNIKIVNKETYSYIDEKNGDKTSDKSTGNADVVLTTVDSIDKNKLYGAIFDLLDEAGNMIREGLTTNGDGIIIIKDLKPGKYNFVQTKASDGYVLDSMKISFEIKSGQHASINLIKENDKEDMIKPNTGSVMLVAVDYKSDYNIPGVEFKLLDYKENMLEEGLVTDRNGKITIKNLKPGKYIFVQTKASEGYRLDSKKIEFQIKNGELVVVKSVNYKNGVYPPGTETGGNNNNSGNTNNTGKLTGLNTNKPATLPQTGGVLGSVGILFAGLSMVGLGVYLFRVKKA